MSFRTKLILLLVLVAAMPVGLAGLLSAYANEQEMTGRIEAFQRKAASLVARGVDDFLTEAVDSLKLATRLIPFDQFPESERKDALRIPYRQFDFVNAVALLDGAGQQLCAPVFESDPGSSPELAAHESVTAEEIAQFGGQIPLSAALATGASFGPAYFNPRTNTPRIALALPFPVDGGKARWVLAVELSLRWVLERVIETRPSDQGTAFVVDGQGLVVCHDQVEAMRARAARGELSLVAQGLATKGPLTGRYTDPQGVEMAGAFAPIPSLGWGLVLAEPVDQAFVAADRIRLNTLVAVLLALLVAIAGGVLLARGVAGPIRMLSEGAAQVGDGRLDVQVPVDSQDEIGRLTGTFNKMVVDLAKSFETIQAQNAEIRGWNEELQERVEARTRELKQAQQQIIQSQKLAAVAELGAGLAHEINNPLTGVMGFLELIQMGVKDDPKLAGMVEQVRKESKRISEIIDDLRRFSVQREHQSAAEVDLNVLAEHALRMVARQLQNAGVQVEERFGDDLPLVAGDPSELQQVLVHLLTNALNAMSEGGRLTLTTTEVEGGAVKISVADTGRGIDPQALPKIFDPFFTTKEDWSGKGLGLSVANRIVEEHQGQILVDSQVGEGSTFSVLLPGVPKKLHLT